MADDESTVVVIGGGPGGLMVAERLAAAGRGVVVVDRMPSAGRKLLLAGRSGLNLTHSEDLDVLLDRYGVERPRLERAIRAFPPAALRAWAEGLGEPTFVGSSGRVFPTSFRATPLLRAWLRRLTDAGVEFRFRQRWIGWDGERRAVLRGPDGEVSTLSADAVVLALGGASWPRTGSDGAWVAPIAATGIEVRPLGPANSGVAVHWSPEFLSRCEGAPLKNLAVRVASHPAVRGELVVTRLGLEGGPVYTLGRAIRGELAATGTSTLLVDLLPDLDVPGVIARLGRRRPGDSTSSGLRRVFNLDTTSRALLRECVAAVPADTARLAAVLKSVPVTVTGVGSIDRAISTAGGVSLEEVDDRWMLRRLPGVFATGEMLDWEAPTGGYLLQATFALAIEAADGVESWLTERAGATW